MNTDIALRRGISVGGNSPWPLKELAAILEGAGAQEVRTSAQSGNAVFRRPEENPAVRPNKLAAEIKKRHVLSPLILILGLGLGVIKRAIAETPFPDAEGDPSSLHLGFLDSQTTNPELERLSCLKKESGRFHLSEGIFYLHAPEGLGRPKLAANVEKLLGVLVTDRNWRTVPRILELAEE